MVLIKAMRSQWMMMIGASQELMLASILPAAENRNPTNGVAMRQYISKWLWGQVLPWYLNFTDLPRDVFAMHMKWLRGQKENPDDFGPYPTAPVSRPRAWLGFKKA